MDKRIYSALTITALAASCGWAALARQQLSLALAAGALTALLGALPGTRLRSAMIVAVSLLATLAVVEVSLPGVHSLRMGTDNGSYYDPASDYVNRYWKGSVFGSQPGPGTFSSRKLARDGQQIYDVKYSIGEDGFRLTPNANSGVDRQINFLGCSFTFGEGLNDDQTLPHYAAQLLTGYRVKNYAMHGWGVHQALAVLESVHEPSRINFLLTVPWHADRSACIPFYSVGSPRYVLNGSDGLRREGVCRQTLHEMPWPIRSMITRPNLYQLINQNLFRSQDREIDLYLAIIKRIRDVSAEQGSQLVVGFMKADQSLFVGRYSNERILSILHEWGIPVIDMTLAEKPERLPRKYFIHEQDRHPSAAANQARATLLAEYLKGRPVK